MKTILNNDRISFRAPEPEDIDLFYRWENDTQMWKFGSTLVPYSRFQLLEYLRNASDDIYASKQLRLMIVDNTTKQAVGTIDLFDFEPHDSRAFIGMMIDISHHRKGYGEEAVQLLIEYAFGHLFMHQLCVHIPVTNVPCLRLYQKMQFTEVGVLHDWIRRADSYEDVYVMQLINIKQ